MFESILCQVTEYGPDVLTSLIELAVEIAREGREGRRVGTLFILGDEEAVLARSRPFRSLSFLNLQSEAVQSDCRVGSSRRNYFAIWPAQQVGEDPPLSAAPQYPKAV
jgi:hypothetical protein